MIDELRGLLGLSADEVQRIKDALDGAPGYQPVPVAENIPYERYAALRVRLPDLTGVAPSEGFARAYPGGAAVAHLVGYVGPASAADYQKAKDALLITPGFKIGKEGLERVMEPWLRGQAGAHRTEVTARGKMIADLGTRPEKVGHTLQLTIDAGLQDYAARRLGPNSGSAVVIDVQTGGILAMASMPAYDPNSFSDGISRSEWAMFAADDHLPLLNKTVQALYPPGSTVKPMVALALLQAGVPPTDTVVCTGQYRVGNGIFHCWSRHGHGAVDMHRAIQQSCDIYFYTMSRRVGIDIIAPMARALGFGQRFDLPFPSQRYGTVPDTKWKLARYRQRWTQADTVNAAIGQGYMLVNPLQLAVMATRIASARDIQPRLIANRRYPSQGYGLGIPDAHRDLVHQAMHDVVNTGGAGTAGAARMPTPGVELAGKTGSAQVRRISMAERARGVISNEALAWKLRDHGHFIGFAPSVEPRYAIAVALEHGGHGAAAGQIARDVMTYCFRPDYAAINLAAYESTWGGNIAARMAEERRRWEEGHGAIHRDDSETAVTSKDGEVPD